MAIKITSVNDAVNMQGVKALLYGKAGAGKTTLCATAPVPIIISAESGLLSLKREHGALPVIEVNSIAELNEAYEWARGSAEAKTYHTVCLDSLSEIGETVLAAAKETAKDPRQAYGEMIEQMTKLVRSFRDLPAKHVLMTAKQEYLRDDVAGTTSYGPSMPGAKLAQNLPYFFDEVFRLGIGKNQETGEDFRFVQTGPDLQHEAKDRSGRLDHFEEPNFSTLVGKILG